MAIFGFGIAFFVTAYFVSCVIIFVIQNRIGKATARQGEDALVGDSSAGHFVKYIYSRSFERS